MTLTMTSDRSSRSRQSHDSGQSQPSSKGGSNPPNDSSDHQSSDLGHVLNSRRNRGHLTSTSRVRQSRSLNRISELHVVADFSENEDLLTRYLDSVNRGGQLNRSRDDSLTSSDGEQEAQQPQRRSKVNLRLLEQRLNKIQEENLNNLKNLDINEVIGYY